MTLKELIQRAVEIAIGSRPVDRTAIELAAEPLLPVVFGEVGDELAASPMTRHLLRRTKTVNLVNGTVALSSDVLTAYACEATLFDPDDTTKVYSRTDWSDLLSGQLDSRLGHWLVDEDDLKVVEPGSQYNPASGATLDLRLIIPCSPVVPAAITDQVDVPPEVIDLLIKRLAQALVPIK